MPRIYILIISIFLFTFCFKAFSKEKSEFINLSQNDPITIEEIEYVFWKGKKKYPEINKSNLFKKRSSLEEEIRKKKRETYEKRLTLKGIAKCMYKPTGGLDEYKRCKAKIIRTVMSYPEKSKKRRPGDIFYFLSALDGFINHWDNRKIFYKIFDFEEGDKVIPGMVCYTSYCMAFRKSTYEKIEKFRKDSSNEKVLGHKLIKYVKNQRIIRNIEENLGTNKYSLIGDFLNSTVVEVKKNYLSPEINKTISLLEKYDLLLNTINLKLDDKKYKSLEKDLSILSKTYEELNSLSIDFNNVDEAINKLYDLHLFTIDSIKHYNKNENNKVKAESSITFLQIFIKSIKRILPEKYYTVTKDLDFNLFNEYDLIDLEQAIKDMDFKNNQIKKNKLEKSKKVLNNYINAENILKSMNSLGIRYFEDKTEITQSLTSEIIYEQINKNLNSDILISTRRILDEFNRNEINTLTKEVSKVASDLASDPSIKSSVSGSGSVLDKKFGEVTLKQLIGASRNR